MTQASPIDETQPIVIGLGELLWDCFDDSRRPGGAPANFAFHAQQLGCLGIVCSRVGDDELGTELREFVKQQGLIDDFIQTDRERPTSRVTVDFSETGHPEYVIHEDVAWDHLEFNDSIKAPMEQADAICFGTLAQRSVVSRETILQCLMSTSENCRIVFDINLRQQWFDRIGIERSLQMCDIVKLNHEEVVAISDLLELHETRFAQFAERLMHQFEIDLVCITEAEYGCFVADRTQSIDVPGIQIEVADAVGAGDAFATALIYTQLHGWPLRQSAEFSNRIGALVASHPGGMPPLKEEFDELKV